MRRKVPFTPLLHGGHQERGLRSGTESVPLIVALGKAAELARTSLAGYDSQVRSLRDRLEKGILESVPGTERNGHSAIRLANTTNLTFRGIAFDALLMLLDQEGICASSEATAAVRRAAAALRSAG
jgi:cysteine desulfurase